MGIAASKTRAMAAVARLLQELVAIDGADSALSLEAFKKLQERAASLLSAVVAEPAPARSEDASVADSSATSLTISTAVAAPTALSTASAASAPSPDAIESFQSPLSFVSSESASPFVGAAPHPPRADAPAPAVTSVGGSRRCAIGFLVSEPLCTVRAGDPVAIDQLDWRSERALIVQSLREAGKAVRVRFEVATTDALRRLLDTGVRARRHTHSHMHMHMHNAHNDDDHDSIRVDVRLCVRVFVCVLMYVLVRWTSCTFVATRALIPTTTSCLRRRMVALTSWTSRPWSG